MLETIRVLDKVKALVENLKDPSATDNGMCLAHFFWQMLILIFVKYMQLKFDRLFNKIIYDVDD